MCTGAIASRETVKQSGRFGAKGGSTMPSASTAATPKGTAAGQSPEKLRLLDSRRLSELLGFLLCVLGLLLFLSLASYLAFDPSLNTSAHFANHIHNWIGPAGSYTADVLFQAFGWAAYLIPGTLMVVGVAKLRDRQPGAPLAKSIGALTLIASASAILELFPLTPMVGETVRGGGLAGYLIALGLVGALNAAGAWIVAVALFLTSLFLLTRFSFSSAAEFSKACWDSTQSWRARWSEWSETRRQERARRKVELHRLIGKAPIVIERPKHALASQAAEPSPSAAAGAIRSVLPKPIPFATPPDTSPVKPAEAPVVKAQGLAESQDPTEPSRRLAPKIVGRGGHAYKLPSATILRPPDDQQSVNEDDL